MSTEKTDPKASTTTPPATRSEPTDDRERGVYPKYHVSRASGKKKPEDNFVVLNVGGCLHGASAGLCFAESVSSTHPLLAADLLHRLGKSKAVRGYEPLAHRVKVATESLARSNQTIRERLAVNDADDQVGATS